MGRNRKTRHDGQRTGFKDQGRINRADQSQGQYSQPSRNSKTFDANRHIRKINRAMCDAYVMFKCWPACIRYSYFIGSDGKLITRAERRAGA